MAGDPTPLGLISARQDRLEERVHDLEEELDGEEGISQLRGEVKVLREALNRNTNALYQGAIALLITGAAGVLTALILRGVLG